MSVEKQVVAENIGAFLVGGGAANFLQIICLYCRSRKHFVASKEDLDDQIRFLFR